jgi:NAD(P)-dependent dehydrogenase (short-subunit alcohol dehydrogenase family)
MTEQQRVAVVTGAASGIGRSIAERLVRDGYVVAALDRDGAGLDRLVAELSPAGPIEGFTVDVAVRGDVDEAIASTADRLGPIAVVVNNAGLVVAGDVPHTSADSWALMIAVNLTGVYHVCAAALPIMLEAGTGAVVNIASASGIAGLRDRAAYCAAKAGVIGLTRAMAADHAAAGIRVNAICPGTIATNLVDEVVARSADPEATRRAMAERQPLGRMGRPEEIAAAVAYLASDDAGFITGTTLVIDGGWTGIVSSGSIQAAV